MPHGLLPFYGCRPLVQKNFPARIAQADENGTMVQALPHNMFLRHEKQGSARSVNHFKAGFGVRCFFVTAFS